MQTRRVNANDVAKAAGVSRTTVSFVLNGNREQRIPQETWDRVLAAAEQLQYAPSPEARYLSRGASNIVLFLVPDWAPSKHMSIYLNHLTQLLAEHGLVGLAHMGYSDDARLEGAWRSLTARAVVPFFALSTEDRAAIERSGSPVYPIDWFQRTLGDEPVLQRAIGRRQAEVFLDRGLTKAAYIGPADSTEEDFERIRYDGFREVMHEATGEWPVRILVENTADAARAALADVKRRELHAIAVYGAQLAAALSSAAHAAGLAIPADLAVLSSDEDDILNLMQPGISSIRLDLRLLAEEHVGSILARLKGQVIAAIDPPLTLVERASLP